MLDFRSPILITGCARSGTTLLYRLLSEVPELWSIGIESKAIIERAHPPASRNWESGSLTAGDLTAETRNSILRQLSRQAAPGTYWQQVNRFRQRINQSPLYEVIKRRGTESATGSAASSRLPGAGMGFFRAVARLRNVLRSPLRVRLLDKSPEHCLRLPFLSALFPDARIVAMVRDGRSNIHSLLAGWRQPHLFPGYELPIPVISGGYTRGRWAFTLIPGWRDLIDRPLEEVCARQWASCNAAILDYAAGDSALPVLLVRYEALIAAPDDVLRRVADFLDLRTTDIPAFGKPLPDTNIISRPQSEKWRQETEAIRQVEKIFRPMMIRLGYEQEASAG